MYRSCTPTLQPCIKCIKCITLFSLASLCLSLLALCLSFSDYFHPPLTRSLTHARTHARKHARTHTHTPNNSRVLSLLCHAPRSLFRFVSLPTFSSSSFRFECFSLPFFCTSPMNPSHPLSFCLPVRLSVYLSPFISLFLSTLSY